MPQVPYQPFQAEFSAGAGEISGQQIQTNPNQFGAGIGAALGEVARATDKAVTDVANGYITLLRQNQNTDYDATHIQWETRWRTALAQRTREAESTRATDFYQNNITEMRNDVNRELSRIPAGPTRDQYRLRYERSLAGMAPGILQSQMRISDATATTQIGQAQDALLVRIAENPENRETALADNERLVRQSTFPPAVQDAMILQFRQRAANATVNEQIRRDPEQMAAHLGGQTAFRATVRQRESSGNDRAMSPTSSATGRYQFITTTWGAEGQVDPRTGQPTGLANTEEGRRLGLRPIPRGGERGANDPRFDPAQQEIAMGIMERRYARILEQENIPVTGGNLYMLHFLGEAGGRAFLQQYRSNPDGNAAEAFPTAAAANRAVFYDGETPRNIAQVYQRMTRGFASGNPVANGPAPASIADLTYENRQSALTTATSAAARRAHEESARITESNNAAINSIQAGITEGRAGRAEIDRLWQTGVLTDAGQRDRMYAAVDRRDQEVQLLRAYDTAAQGQGLNPHSTEERRIATAGYNAALRRGLSPVDAGIEVFNRTGVLPEPAADTLLNMANSTNTQQVQRAIQTLLNIAGSGRSTAPFAGMPNSSALSTIAATAMERFQRNDPIADIVQAQVAANTPADQTTSPANRQRARDFETRLRDTQGGQIAREFRTWAQTFMIPGSGRNPQFMPGQEAYALDNYLGFARERFEANGGDERDARAYATARMRDLWGVSNGWIVRMPAERVYPPAMDQNGRLSQDYIYEQALRFTREQTGRNVNMEDIALIPLTNGQTAAMWRQGQPAPYAVMYQWRDAQGFMQNGVVRIDQRSLAAPFAADPQAALRRDGQVREPEVITRAREAAQGRPVRLEDVGPHTTFLRGELLPQPPLGRGRTLEERQAIVDRMNADAGGGRTEEVDYEGPLGASIRRRDYEILQQTQPVTEADFPNRLGVFGSVRAPEDITPQDWVVQENARRAEIRRQYFRGRPYTSESF